MNQQEYLIKLHTEIQEILDEVKCICDKHNIKYYLIGGTLLGAVRHKGFIPWDDDLDITMPRKDFDEFIRLAPSELPDSLKLLWITTDKSYQKLHAKVCRKGTSFVEEIGQGCSVDCGIFIDIFPIDITSGYNKLTRIQKIAFVIFNKLLIKKKISFQKGNMVGYWRRIIPNVWFHNLATKILTLQQDKGGLYYTSFASHYDARRQTIPQQMFGEGKEIEFAGKKYLAPQDYDYILRSVFGEKYIELPPLEKRETHIPKTVIFSDGTIYENSKK